MTDMSMIVMGVEGGGGEEKEAVITNVYVYRTMSTTFQITVGIFIDLNASYEF